jgi:hypothetical protein
MIRKKLSFDEVNKRIRDSYEVKNSNGYTSQNFLPWYTL